MGLRAAYIATAVLVLGMAAGGAVLWADLPWLPWTAEPAQAVPDQAVPDQAVPDQAIPDKAIPNRKGDPEPLPLRSNAEVKMDRLAVRTPEKDLPPNTMYETARQFMAAPVVAPAKPPVAIKPKGLLLDDQQIAAIKTRLKLTAAQEKYWPPVEQALRDVVAVLYASRKPVAAIDLNHESVQRLLAASGPFLQQLRADQKDQIQLLMHVAGFGNELPKPN